MNRPNQIVLGRFRLIKKIGQGSFGQIYSCHDNQMDKKAAIKIEMTNKKGAQLPYEAKLYKILNESINIPKTTYYGSDKNQNFLVMDLCGKSLEGLLKANKRPFALKTVLMLATQMLSAIEFIHKKDYVHRDIKPENFVMGIGSKDSTVYLIDFGLSKRFRDAQTHQHIPYAEKKALTGTARYASVPILNGIESSRRDDLESLGYVLLYLLNGTLPWMGMGPAAERDSHYEQIRKKKESITTMELCNGLPIEFVEYFEIIKSMGFDEEPKYAVLRSIFTKLSIREGFIWDWKYDWTKNSCTSKDAAGTLHCDDISIPTSEKVENTPPPSKTMYTFRKGILNIDVEKYFTRTPVIKKNGPSEKENEKTKLIAKPSFRGKKKSQ